MFTINGEVWRVRFVPPNHPSLLKPDKTFAIGACDDYSKTIFLSMKLKGSTLKRVLCHEITHAAMFSYNILMSLPQEELVAELVAAFGDEIIRITNLIFSRLYKMKGRF